MNRNEYYQVTTQWFDSLTINGVNFKDEDKARKYYEDEKQSIEVNQGSYKVLVEIALYKVKTLIEGEKQFEQKNTINKETIQG